MAPSRNTRADKRKAVVVNISDDTPDEANASEPPHSQQAVASEDLYSNWTEQFRVNVLEVWKEKIDEEVQKREVFEASLQEAATMCMFYEDRTVALEGALKESEGVEGASAPVSSRGPVEREVQSRLKPIECDVVCKVCRIQIANIVWVPCRHLCVCENCNKHLNRCPICNEGKLDVFRVSWDVQPEVYQQVLAPTVLEMLPSWFFN